MVKKDKSLQKINDNTQINDLYSTYSQFVSGIYITPLLYPRSTMVRLTFTEANPEINKQFPVCAVSMTIENLQSCYNLMTKILQQAREQKRID